MQLTYLDFGVIVGYFAALSLLGIYFSRRQTSEESYFLGDRGMPAVIVGVSIMATLVSTLSYLSVPGEMIRHGLGYFASLVAFVAVIPAVTRIIIPALMRLPVTSVYEYFEKRYHLSVRVLAAAVFILMRVTWVGLIIYSASFAVAAMTGWNTSIVIVVVGVITTFYTTVGGMPAVVWSDFIQGLMLVGAAIFIPIFIGLQTWTGPLQWWDVFSQAGRAQVPLFSWDPTVRLTVVGMIIEVFFWHICTHSADQVAAQRYLSTSSIAQARRSVWVSALFTIVLLVLLMIVGLALFGFYFQQSPLPVGQFQQQIASTADNTLPDFIARELPSGVSGLILAALLAAAMSSLSAGINSISSVVVTDFLERFGGRWQIRRGLGVAMATAATTGVLGVAMALAVNQLMLAKSQWNLVDMIERINHLFVAPLGVAFLAGVLFRRVGTVAVMLGFASAAATSILVSFGKEIFGMERGFSFNWIIPASFAVGMAAAYLAGYIFAAPTAAQLAVFSDEKRDR